ncbi:cystathionine beta-lyase [Magnetovibrio sp. PR-2]|uniref:cystathionine beta-lyase n=1 Tax=Magnetovibrio sp. PR-2 TaxID=3120356 RepID=UPI002FCE22EB
MDTNDKSYKPDTRLTTAGRDPKNNYGIVNPPVYHASTVTFETMADLHEAEQNRFDQVYYGRYGTPTTFAFEEAVADLEGGDHCISVPSGMASIAVALAATLHQGEHALITDSAYFPTVKFCDTFLKKFGVEVTYYDPMATADEIKALMRPNTKVVFTEAPGSITFEVQDIPMIAQIAHDGGALVVMDNTWSAGYYYKPFEHGVDISLQAATKYIVGHSDAMLGTVTMKDRALYEHIKTVAVGMGYSTAPDDAYLGLRGIRSLAARMPRHQDTGLELANWLVTRPEVETVLHPALPSCPGHDIWKRDFTGASGLFGFVLKGGPTKDDMARMLDNMKLFAMGYSWGGFESLIIPSDPRTMRTTYTWPYNQPVLRIQSGMEDPQDLRTDLQTGLDNLKA